MFSLLAPVRSRACLDALVLLKPSWSEFLLPAPAVPGTPHEFEKFILLNTKHRLSKNQSSSGPKTEFGATEKERGAEGNVKVPAWQWSKDKVQSQIFCRPMTEFNVRPYKHLHGGL